MTTISFGQQLLKVLPVCCRKSAVDQTTKHSRNVLKSSLGSTCKLSTYVPVTSVFYRKSVHFKNRQKSKLDLTQEHSYSTAAATSAIKTSVDNDGRIVTVCLKDGTDSRFHSIWLRNNCRCDDCVHQSSGMKRLDVAEINPEVKVESVENNGNGLLEIKWTNDDHVGHIPVEYLREYSYFEKNYCDSRISSHSEKRIIPEIEYKEVASGKSGVLNWLRKMDEYGLCLIKNLPNEDWIVVKIAENIAPALNNVSYGDKFDVLSLPDPSNVANSTEGLYFHCDMPYYESPPGLQFLHCIKFDGSVTGGETTFLDAFHVAEKFRHEHPEEFDTLTRIPGTFRMIHYERDNPVHMTYQRPHIAVNHKKEIVGIYWAAAIEAPLSVPADDVEAYYRAYHKFAAAIKYSPVIRELKLQPGDLIVFNNRRFLHGRNSFQLNGGTRHFQGCYINSDEFKSQLHVLSTQLGDNRPINHVGNQSWN